MLINGANQVGKKYKEITILPFTNDGYYESIRRRDLLAERNAKRLEKKRHFEIFKNIFEVITILTGCGLGVVVIWFIVSGLMIIGG